MKKNFILFLFCCLSVSLWATSAGNLRIINTGTSSTEPKGGWNMGIGEKGVTYTITAATISSLLDSNLNNLTLGFDTIFISGNVVINRSNASTDQYLRLQTNDYQTGAIIFENGASLTIQTSARVQSYIVISTGNLGGTPQLTATQVKLSNAGKAYQRINMTGFTNWHQWQIDTLLAHADKVGPDIGNGAYDFTNNTQFTIDSNHVFSMKALTSFQGKTMGFKNMDRGGTLLPGTFELGAYPDSFYVDLSNADGIRFKVNLQGSASNFNIGLSNCLKENGWHVYCFEYYVYNIPFTAVDKDGYVTLPFSAFEKLGWSGVWDLSKLIVFIMEVNDAATNTVVSFSDVHGYKVITENQPCLTVGNIHVNGELVLSSDEGYIRQLPNTRIEASSCQIAGGKNVILANANNYFGEPVVVNTPYAFLQMQSKTSNSSTYHFNAQTISQHSVNEVWIDNVSQGTALSTTLTTQDTLTHTYEICYNASNCTLSTEHWQDVCNAATAQLIASGSGKSSQYHWYDAQLTDLGYTDTLTLPAFTSDGIYRYFVELDTTISNRNYLLTRSASVEVHPVYTMQIEDSICAGETYQLNGFDIESQVEDGGQVIFDTLNLSTVFGCDSTCYLQLYLYPQALTEINDTIIVGETYTKYGFDISGTEVGTADFTDSLNSEFGCDSIVVLHLTTLLDEGIANIQQNPYFKLYPNPTYDKIRFEQSATDMVSELRLYDVFGRLVMQTSVQDDICEISLSELASGFYFLNIYNAQQQLMGVMKVQKIDK